MKKTMLALTLFAATAQAGTYHNYSHDYHRYHRSREVTKQFQRLHPCPSTGKTYGACPNFTKDHIVPLCKGGPDTVANLQWQENAAAKAKDKWECKR